MYVPIRELATRFYCCLKCVDGPSVSGHQNGFVGSCEETDPTANSQSTIQYHTTCTALVFYRWCRGSQPIFQIYNIPPFNSRREYAGRGSA
jgi:hypothetical protein